MTGGCLHSEAASCFLLLTGYLHQDRHGTCNLKTRKHFHYCGEGDLLSADEITEMGEIAWQEQEEE